MIFLGIDPGQKGGIALISESGVEVFPYSDDTLKSMCRRLHETTDSVEMLCFIEKVGAMPKQGLASTFNFGKSFGYILGVVEANSIPYQLVSPQKWKNHFGITGDKSNSVLTAKRLFPNVNLFSTPKCKKESDGMAEALLIALYAKRTQNGKSE